MKEHTRVYGAGIRMLVLFVVCFLGALILYFGNRSRVNEDSHPRSFLSVDITGDRFFDVEADVCESLCFNVKKRLSHSMELNSDVSWEKCGFSNILMLVDNSMFLLSPDEISALLLSIKVAGICVLCIAGPGIFLGWLMARKDFKFKSAIDAFIHLPLIMPPVVTGYILLLIFGPTMPLGRLFQNVFGVDLAFTWKAAVIASGVMALPLLVRSVRLAVEMVDPGLESAAKTLGSGPLKTFFSVTFPLSMPGIICGMVLAFARSLGEFGATATFAGNIAGQTRTLSLSIYSLTQVPGKETMVARLVVFSVVISVLSLVFSEMYSRKLQRRLGFKNA